ncbi:MAG: hypothetical protein PVJ02_18890, partial [Gemmatimonadota bacterium]|jgi:hypothetical protein
VGGLWSARVERAGRELSYSAEIEDSNEGFDAGSGFMRRVGDTQVQSSIRYNRYGDRGSLVERWGPSLELRGYWDHDAFWGGDRAQETSAQLGGSVSFRGNVSFFLNAKLTSFHFTSTDYEGFMAPDGSGVLHDFYPDQHLFQGLRGINGMIWANTFERIRGNARFSWDEVPVFGGSNAAVEPADSWSGNLSLNLYPTRSLQAEVGVRHTTITRKQDGSEYSSATIPRVKAQYQFTRALFVRGIFEYSAESRGALLSPVTGRVVAYCDSEGTCEERTGSDSNDFHVEGLVSYEPSPGTVFYVGYVRQMEDMDAFRFRQIQPLADGLFVKVSYRFRF